MKNKQKLDKKAIKKKDDKSCLNQKIMRHIKLFIKDILGPALKDLHTIFNDVNILKNIPLV